MRLIGKFHFPAFVLVMGLAAALSATAQTSAGLTGRIISSTDGSPMANALVTITRIDVPGTYRIKTDKNGKFSYYTLPTGVFALTVTCPDGNVYPLQRRIRTSPGRLVEATFKFKVPGAAEDAAAAANPPSPQPAGQRRNR